MSEKSEFAKRIEGFMAVVVEEAAGVFMPYHIKGPMHAFNKPMSASSKQKIFRVTRETGDIVTGLL
jgi:hypothetical protein